MKWIFFDALNENTWPRLNCTYFALLKDRQIIGDYRSASNVKNGVYCPGDLHPAEVKKNPILCWIEPTIHPLMVTDRVYSWPWVVYNRTDKSTWPPIGALALFSFRGFALAGIVKFGRDKSLNPQLLDKAYNHDFYRGAEAYLILPNLPILLRRQLNDSL